MFSKNLKSIRESKEYSQKKLAELLNTDIEQIRRFEQSKQKSINFDLLDNLVKTLNCTYDDLFKN